MLFHEIERDEAVRPDAEIGRPARQHLRHVHARSALEDHDVEPGLPVEPLGERFIEPAMLGLRLPVGDEADFGERRGRGRDREDKNQCREKQALHGEPRADGTCPTIAQRIPGLTSRSFEFSQGS